MRETKERPREMVNAEKETKQDRLEGRKKFSEPKLTFTEPRITRQGDATKITGNGFFGTFFP